MYISPLNYAWLLLRVRRRWKRRLSIFNKVRGPPFPKPFILHSLILVLFIALLFMYLRY